jgi:asparagine synthase (glutamine-hydrolysing)
MCGIVGWIDEQADLCTQGATLEQMVRCLIPRGPDEQGQWLSAHAALAHRRLIVLDPPGGRQPMCYQEGERTYVLTYNGEIYNFRDLRAELEQQGHRFHTRSDTEVVLHAYAAWGEACVQRFNGIFAFGLWDVQRQRLLLARDHLGVKPLFYAQRGRALLFASELKALLAHPLVEPVVGTEGLAEIFSFGRMTPGCGIYHDVHEVRAGSLLRYEQGVVRTERFWRLRSAPHLDDVETTAARVRALLEETVQRQLIADVPVVTMLSGGLDSSGVTALAGRAYGRTGQRLQTYSVDFVDSAQHFEAHLLRPDQDAPWVQRVAEHVGSDHQTVLLDTPELVEHLLVPMRAHDLPSMGQMETSLYLLCQAIKQKATVALSGESADEVFGGYPWFHDPVALARPTFPWLAMAQASTERGPFAWLSAELREQITPEAYLEQRYQEALAEVPRLEGEAAPAARLREVLYLNQTRFLSMLLNRKDRMSMATGLEVRVPFCDYRLVEYVWNIPWEMKCDGGIEKGLLRRALADVLPEDVRRRRKSAYPASYHPAYARAIQDWTQQVLSDPTAPIRALVNVPVVQAMAADLPVVSEVPKDFVVTLLERVIVTNSWLQEYRVRIC